MLDLDPETLIILKNQVKIKIMFTKLNFYGIIPDNKQSFSILFNPSWGSSNIKKKKHGKQIYINILSETLGELVGILLLV